MTKSRTAFILADTISPAGHRLTTFEIKLPKVLLAELNTHRALSRNFSSSRAIPTAKFVEIESFAPKAWLKNQAGMVARNEEVDDVAQTQHIWKTAIQASKDYSKYLSELGLHKQWANRMTEWFSPIKVVVTATEWDNFFWLRIDPEAAQPEIVELARKMKETMDKSTPQLLQPGEWHLPYVVVHETENGLGYFLEDDDSDYYQIDLETAKKVSAGCCAAVSYRNNPSVEKCLEIWDKLFSGPKPHLSPVEHQATPMIQAEHNVYEGKTPLEEGITSYSSDLYCYSGNLRGWVQLRQVI